MGAFATAVLAKDPWCFYENNETSGTAAADSSTHGQPGTFQGTPTLGQTSMLVDNTGKSWVPGNANSWLRLSGASWMNPATGGLSVLQLFKLSALPPTLGTLFARDDASGSGRSWVVYVTSTGGLRFIGSSSTVANVDQSSTGLTLALNKRYCLAMVWDYSLNNVKHYLRAEDGSASVPFTVTGFTGVALGDTLRPFTIGALDTRADLAWYHRGNIQGTAFFPSVLSASDFETISAAAFVAAPSDQKCLMGALWP